MLHAAISARLAFPEGEPCFQQAPKHAEDQGVRTAQSPGSSAGQRWLLGKVSRVCFLRAHGALSEACDCLRTLQVTAGNFCQTWVIIEPQTGHVHPA